jgi:CheY-like chemotaxis protein
VTGTSGALSGADILVVDDNEINRELLRAIFSMTGTGFGRHLRAKGPSSSCRSKRATWSCRRDDARHQRR